LLLYILVCYAKRGGSTGMISYRMIHDVMPDALDLFLKKMKK
jgi:hypothetical protein